MIKGPWHKSHDINEPREESDKVYHTNHNCEEGQKIPVTERELGEGLNRYKCPDCEELDSKETQCK